MADPIETYVFMDAVFERVADAYVVDDGDMIFGPFADPIEAMRFANGFVEGWEDSCDLPPPTLTVRRLYEPKDDADG